MIRMISGSTRISEGYSHEIKTPKSGPFCATEEQEARLVRLGVAEYVNSSSECLRDSKLKKEVK